MTEIAKAASDDIVKTSVSKEFGPSFEEKIIQAMLGDARFAERMMDVLEPSLFDLLYTEEIASKIKQYYHKYEHIPTADILENIITKDLDNDKILQKSCFDYIVRIKKKPLNGDSEYVKENSLNYFKTQHIKNVLANEVIPRIKESNFDEIVPIIQQAMVKGSDNHIGYDYNEDCTKRFIEEVIEKVPTPWKVLNEVLNGGLGKGRLLTVIAPSGVGKSHALVNIGKGALLEGKTVVHYTLELDEIDVARRYDATLTGVDINEVPNNKKYILERLKDKLPKESKLIIKMFPMKSASVQTIKSHLSRLRILGKIPDIIIIDYGDLLKAINVHRENRFDLKAVWENMKSLAQEMSIPVATATQTNRGGYDCEVITPDQVAEDFSKIMTSDIILTMSRYLKMLLAKNRQGQDGQIYMYNINTAKSTIEILEQEETLEEKLHSNPDEEAHNALSQFLKKKKGQK